VDLGQMTTTRTYSRSFSGGEITPEMFGQLADAKFQTGLATCRNFVVLPHGPVANRPGTRFVRAVKDSTKKTRLIPFTYSNTQTMIIEMGAGYFRFHTQGATLLSSGSPYEVSNPYAEADLFDIHYVQSADVLTLVHPGYAPRELRRLGATSWSLTTISFASALAAPTSVTATATAATVDPAVTWRPSATTQEYVVTSVGSDGIEESVASSTASCSNMLLESGAYNTIAWTGATGASRYNVYRRSSGLWGYVGQSDTTSFKDGGDEGYIRPDLSITPPIATDPFNASNKYPGAVSYFEQRRVFAGSNNLPQTVWMTRTGTESNLNYSLPVRDDDSIEFRLAAREANQIRHLVPLGDLVLLTAAAEWRLNAGGADAVTPTQISVRAQSYVGANQAQPVVVNNNVLYAAARGGHMREMAYNWQANGYLTGDMSLRAPHLFDGYDIVDLAYAKSPVPVVWAVSTSGKLLGITYVPEQQIGAWHQHDTDGVFESVAVVSEGSEDAVYVVVKRTLNGTVTRCVERFGSRLFTDDEDAYFVDCGVTYDSTPATTITGLTHLNGEIVSILADGAVQPQQVVTGGEITLDVEASVVHIGLPIEADFKTLPLALEVPGAGQGRPKNVNRVYLRVYRSSGVFAGPDTSNLTELKQRTSEPWGSPPALISDEVEIDVLPDWDNSGGQLVIRQSDPLPLTVCSLSLDVAIGG
jgi:hypothetical protein